MRQNSKIIYYFLLFSIVFCSCKKDVDNYGPTITITSPLENQSFNVNDVVQVKGTVKDDVEITWVSVSLVDAQQNPVHVAMSVPVTSPSMNVNILYTLDNIHLETGFYYILISASDGKNDSRAYRRIYITAIPKVVKGIYVATASSSSQTNLAFIDSAFTTLSPYKTFTGDYIGSSVSSYYQQVYMCGNYTGSFMGIKLSDNIVKFSVSPIISSLPYFTAFYNDDKNNYVARYDEFIYGYDFAGNVIYSAITEGNFYIEHFCFNNNYMITEQKDKTSAIKKLITYFPTGSPQQSKAVNQDVVEFVEKDNENVFLFGNVSGQGVIQLYDRINNNIWNPYPYSLATGSILSAVKIDADTYLFGHSNGTIYKYNFQSSGVVTYLTGYTAIQLKYDFAKNRLYIAEANSISSVDYPSATPINSVPSTETILDLHLLYNR